MKKFHQSTFVIAIAASIAILGCQPASTDKQSAIDAELTAAKPHAIEPIVFDSHIRDVRDDVFYFVLPDRFNNANPSNDNGSDTLKISNGGLDITSKWAFHGGDMQGIEAKLDYLQNLGVTAIWMTPILRNQATQLTGFAHHGYWILDFTQIDPHFGSNDDLRSLISAAHARGMKIFFDIITNHTADIIRFEECHNPDGTWREGLTGCEYKSTEQLAAGDTYTPFIPKGLETVKTPAWLNDPKYYHNQGDSFWQGESALNGDFVGLDDLKTSHPDVVNGMIDIYKNIITEFKPDGFRIDTVKHVDLSFWESFSPAIMGHAASLGIEHFHIFGEVYDGNPAVLSRYTTLGKMPSVLDFGIQYATADLFYKDYDKQSVTRLFNNDDYYNDADSDPTVLMNFLGNHDMGRAGMFLKQAQPNASDDELVQRNLLSHAFMYLSRGIPVIYYGDEQGFTGDGGDVDARENMFASQVESYNDNDLIGSNATTAIDNFDQTHPLYIGLAELAKLRQSHSTLRYGKQQIRYVGDRSTSKEARKVVAFSRFEPNSPTEYIAIFNPTPEQQEVELQGYGNYLPIVPALEFKHANGQIMADIAPFSFILYHTERPITPAKPSSIKLLTQAIDNERIHLGFQLDIEEGLVGSKSNRDLPAIAVKTYLIDQQGTKTLASVDYTSPYQAIIPPELMLNTKHIEVIADDGQGNQVSHTALFSRALLP